MLNTILGFLLNNWWKLLQLFSGWWTGLQYFLSYWERPAKELATVRYGPLVDLSGYKYPNLSALAGYLFGRINTLSYALFPNLSALASYLYGAIRTVTQDRFPQINALTSYLFGGLQHIAGPAYAPLMTIVTVAGQLHTMGLIHFPLMQQLYQLRANLFTTLNTFSPATVRWMMGELNKLANKLYPTLAQTNALIDAKLAIQDTHTRQREQEIAAALKALISDLMKDKLDDLHKKRLLALVEEDPSQLLFISRDPGRWFVQHGIHFWPDIWLGLVKIYADGLTEVPF